MLDIAFLDILGRRAAEIADETAYGIGRGASLVDDVRHTWTDAAGLRLFRSVFDPLEEDVREVGRRLLSQAEVSRRATDLLGTAARDHLQALQDIERGQTEVRRADQAAESARAAAEDAQRACDQAASRVSESRYQLSCIRSVSL